VLVGLVLLARAPVELAAQSSAGHPGFAAHALHLLGDIATRPDRFDVDRSVARAPRLVEPAEQWARAFQCVVVPGAMIDESRHRLTLEKLLASLEPVQRLARLAALRQDPGGGRAGTWDTACRSLPASWGRKGSDQVARA
jgi:hypothetical protein